jgi:sigma-B regulation protein RsbU (phosphoserine phosphatase)
MDIHLSAVNAIRLAVAVIVMASGLVSLWLFLVRIRRRELSLLYFGLGAGMYGARLFLQVIGQPTGAAALLLTLFIPIPLILFMVEVVAPEWGKAAWWIVAADFGVGVFAVVTRLLHWSPRIAWSAISIAVLVELPFIVVMAFFPRRPPDRDLRIVRTGIAIFLLFAIYTNLWDLGVFPRANVEFIGFTIVLCCLGYVALSRMQRNEEHLLSLQKELEIARNIQAQLLPQANSAVAGLAIASRYVPVSSVAGDFYDFLAKDGGMGVLIADVSGHGIPAALSASMVKVAVRAQMDRAADPAEVLYGMNSILCGNLQGQFVSAGYLFLEPARGRLTYSGAGHPPLLVWRSRQRQVESVEENGMLLGIFPGSPYTVRTAPLEGGDRCLLYTDGLLEAPGSSGEEYGAERLKGFLAEHASLAPQRFCDALVEDLVQWCGKARQLPDDVTIVAIEVS